MRKLISFLLTAAVAVSCLIFPVTVSAADGSPEIAISFKPVAPKSAGVDAAYGDGTVDPTNLHKGDEFMMVFSLKTNPGLTAFRFTIKYDNSVIYTKYVDANDPILGIDATNSEKTFIDMELFGICSGLEPTLSKETGEFSIVFGGSRPVTKTEEICAIKFFVNDDVTFGTDGTAKSGLKFEPIEFTRTSGDNYDNANVKFTYTAPVVVCEHKDTTKKETPATCGAEGKIETVCTDCGTVVNTEVTDPTGKHTFSDPVETKKPTCTEEGEETGTCTVCGKTDKQPIPATGHDWGEWTEVTPATCEADGVKEKVCKNDATHKEPGVIPALGHDWGDWTEVTPAACEVEGLEERVCKNDEKHKETNKIPALEHEADWEITKEATCSEEGERTGVCKICGKDVTQTIDKLAHTWGDWEETKAATETEEGEETRTCEECGETETRPISKLGSTVVPDDDDDNDYHYIITAKPSETPSESDNTNTGSDNTGSTGSTGGNNTGAIDGTVGGTDGTTGSTAAVTLTDATSGIVVSGEVPAGATLSVVLNSASYTASAVAYDITLKDANGNVIQPNGNVTVTIPVPAGWNGNLVRVYRAEADGSYTDMNAAHQDGNLVFTTNHFSTYVVTTDVLNGDNNVNTANFPVAGAIVLMGAAAATAAAVLVIKKRK